MRRAFAKYIIPTIIALLFGQVAPIVDSLCISNALGETALSAISTINPVYYFFNIIAVLGGVGGGVGIAKASGSGEKEKGGRIFTKTLVTVIAVSIVLSVLCLIFIEPLLVFLSATEENHGYAKEYLTVLLAGMVFYVLNFSLTYILTDDNNPNLAMAGGIVAGIVNIIIDYTGMMVLKKGIWVTAFGTVFGMFVSCLVFLLHLRKKDRICRIVLKKDLKRDVPLKEIISPGAPGGFQYILFTVQFLIINRLLSSYMGTSGLGNAAIVENIELIGTIFTSGVGEAVLPLFASYYGEENRGGLKMVKRSALILGQIVMLPFVLFLFLRPDLIITLFSVNDPLMIRTLPSAIRFTVLTLYIIMTNSILTSCLQSTDEEKKASFSVVLLAVVQIIFTVLLSFIYPENAPWLAALIGNLCVLSYFVLFCRQFSDMGLHSPDNICMITSGYSVKEEIEGFYKAAKQFISEKDAELLWSSLFEPFLAAILDGRKLPCSFLVLEKENGGHSVILRYDAPESIIENDTMAETEGLYDQCIRSEFNFVQRLMINFRQ